MPTHYVMTMNMTSKPLFSFILLAVALTGFDLSHAQAMGRRDEQDAARRAMLEGQVMPFSIIKRRVEAEMDDATYLGSEFNPSSNRYRLKYVKDGKVVWVDVDGRTGDIIGWAR